MFTLVIHAPENKLGRDDTKSFDDTFRTGIGKAYALNSKIFSKISPGCRVVLLCKVKKRRAEGQLVWLEPAIKDDSPWVTENGIQRYDVFVENFEKTPYKPEALNRNGVAVI